MKSNIISIKHNISINKKNKINNSRNNSNNISIIYPSKRNNAKIKK